MEIAPGGGDGGVAEGGLDEVDRRTAIERMRGVGVPEPVRRDPGSISLRGERGARRRPPPPERRAEAGPQLYAEC